MARYSTARVVTLSMRCYRKATYACLSWQTKVKKTSSSTTFMLILLSLSMFFYVSKSSDLGSCKLESELNILHIAMGHIVTAQPFSNLIYWNTSMLHIWNWLCRNRPLPKAHTWSFWIWRNLCFHSSEATFLVQPLETTFT